MKPRYLFDDWDLAARRLRAARKVALILDFDGTLAPIRIHPELVELPDAMRDVLKRLARCARIWILSGRRGADLRKRIRVRGVHLLGAYGLESHPRGVVFDRVREAYWKLARSLRGLPGVWIENKKACVAIHYRQASRRDASVARKLVRQAALPGTQVLYGKLAWEVVPHNAPGKGGAVVRLLSRMSPGTLPVYAGDDTADEPAFAEISARSPGALTVRVGRPRHTAARYYLRSPREVWEFLRRMEVELT